MNDTDYYKIYDQFTNEERVLKESVRRFLDKEIRPLVLEAFHTEEPLDMRKIAPKMGRMGLIGADLPQKYGCPGASYVDLGIICQEVERVDSSLRSYVEVQSGLVMTPLYKFGTEEQKKKWLPALASGEAIGCFGLTEPNCGSDVSSLETVAKKDGKHWILNGTKQWISEASLADMAVVWAKTDHGIQGFIVERGQEGFTQSFQKHKGSMRAGDVGELAFVDCRVPEENVLPEATGIKATFACLNHARYGISWGAVGAAIDCYETALRYSLERVQFGAPIASYQLVQDKLVTMLIEITKAQLLAYRLGRLMDEGKAMHGQISMAKKNNIKIARMCARTARELMGANGISLDSSPMRHMANIESVYTYQGTDHIHTLILGMDITGISAFGR
ncbi:MAG: acyl-CoA dehydrogenase [Spirochaetes bacterium RBG_16_49_21]|nr:MAG: acyl-CoA dehydrogenase [Spirochaetes bacterium RBG_16_49_21]